MFNRSDGAALPRHHIVTATVALTCLFADARAYAGGPTTSVSAGDTAWVLASAALVLLMTPGLALFYAGMVRAKNALNMYMQSFMPMALVSVLWLIVGYSLAFSPGSAVIGGLQWLGMRDVGAQPNAAYSPSIAHAAFAVYQLMFAIITPALISGAVADRMRFVSYALFVALWSLLVYAPLAHMVWGVGGFLKTMGALDFAGGTVVHISSGASALVLALLLGRRRLDPSEDMRPHNLPMTLLGAGLLWFGWFGFNAGSALAADGVAVNAFIATHMAASSAALCWSLLEWAVYRRPTALGFATGAVAGLVAITPASGYVAPPSAAVIGALVAPLSFCAIRLKNRFGYDDALDVFGVHCVGGVWGALATGLFASTAVNAAGANGALMGGGPALLAKQTVGVLVAIIAAAVGTLIIGLVLRVTTGLRVPAEAEEAGLDLWEHGEVSYAGTALGAEHLSPEYPGVGSTSTVEESGAM